MLKDRKKKYDERYRKKNKKECLRRTKEWEKKNPEKKKKIRRNYYWRNREQEIKRMKEWRKNNKDKIKEYRKKNKFKTNVHIWTSRHFKKQKCEFCNLKEDLQFHHYIYRIPVQKEDIIVLCRKCHKMLHRIGGGEDYRKLD